MQTYSIFNSLKMNGVLIAFLVIVIIVSIFMVVQYYNPTYLIQNPVPLNTLNSKDKKQPYLASPEQYSIKVSEFDNPGSNRYFYEGWFYIDSNESTSTENILFNRGNDFVVTLNGSTLNVYTNVKPPSQSPSQSQSSSGVLAFDSAKPLISLPSFPFQKWCHLVINVDGLSVDLYIDGKFVKNVKSGDVIGTNTSDPITYGNQYTVGHLTRFRRMPNSINPQTVWNNYMLGNGQMTSITNYHVNAQITKNKNVRVDQRII